MKFDFEAAILGILQFPIPTLAESYNKLEKTIARRGKEYHSRQLRPIYSIPNRNEHVKRHGQINRYSSSTEENLRVLFARQDSTKPASSSNHCAQPIINKFFDTTNIHR